MFRGHGHRHARAGRSRRSQGGSSLRISIVTPVWNDVRVATAIASVQAQRTSSDIEHIVVDGGSTNEVLSLIQKHSAGLARFVSEPDRGIYDAMNKGIRLATGDVVGILNADDRFHGPDVVEAIARAFSDPDVDGCYGDLLMVDAQERPRRFWRAGRYGRDRWRFGWMPPHPTFYLRRQLYEAYGLYREDLSIAADYELMLRMCLVHGARMRYVEHTLVRFALGGASTNGVRAILRSNAQVRRAWRLNGLEGGALVPFLKPLRKVPQYLHVPKAVSPNFPRVSTP